MQKPKESSETSPSAMDTTTAGRAPPPYDTILDPSIETVTTENVFGCIFITLSREQTLPASHKRAKAPVVDLSTYQNRLCNFVSYTLAADYEINLGLMVTAEDRDVFLTMGRWLLRLYRANEKSALSSDDIEQAASTMHDLITKPCFELGLPIDHLVVVIVRYLRQMDRSNRYQSCVWEVFRVDGIYRFAEKMHLDNALIARTTVVRDLRSRAALQVTLKDQYYAKYCVVVRRDRPNPHIWRICDTCFGFTDGPRVPITLNARGKEAAKQWEMRLKERRQKEDAEQRSRGAAWKVVRIARKFLG